MSTYRQSDKIISEYLPSYPNIEWFINYNNFERFSLLLNWKFIARLVRRHEDGEYLGHAMNIEIEITAKELEKDGVPSEVWTTFIYEYEHHSSYLMEMASMWIAESTNTNNKTKFSSKLNRKKKDKSWAKIISTSWHLEILNKTIKTIHPEIQSWA